MNRRGRRSPVLSVSLVAAAAGMALWLPVQAIGSAQRAGGRIEGRVSISAPAAVAPPSGAYSTRRVDRPVAPISEILNVIVSVKDAPKPASMAAMRATILQQNETFVPHVIAITRGSTVDFPNGDPFFHDVFSLSRNGTFDLGSYPKGKTKSQVFRQAGLIKVYCHIHSHMSASIMVFDHPYFAIPKADGTFTIDDVPGGSYTVSAWHERIGESPQAVRVDAGRTSDVQFSLPISAK